PPPPADGELARVEVDRLATLAVGRAGCAGVARDARAPAAEARGARDREAAARVVPVGEVAASLVEGGDQPIDARHLVLLPPVAPRQAGGRGTVVRQHAGGQWASHVQPGLPSANPGPRRPERGRDEGRQTGHEPLVIDEEPDGAEGGGRAEQAEWAEVRHLRDGVVPRRPLIDLENRRAAL